MSIRFPVYQPSLLGNEKRYVNDCLESNWISSRGSYIQHFEEEFARYTGRKYATTVCNGTAAIYLALKALGIGKGDEVIVPTLVYVAVPNMVLESGAKAVFVDSLYGSLQMDPEDIEQKISPKTKAVIAVHNYGHPCDMEAISSICQQRGILLIEDNAEALGSSLNGKPVGEWGTISTYSFFGNKTLTTGEGGMVVSDSEELINKVFHLKNQGVTSRTYWHDQHAYNFRMTNIAAAIGLAQLEKIEPTLKRKSEIADLYRIRFTGSPLEFHRPLPGVIHSYWMCSILTPSPADREPLREWLQDQGIETRPFFYPAHTMPAYRAENQEEFPVATNLASRGINLPSYPSLKDEEVHEIAGIVLEYYKH